MKNLKNKSMEEQKKNLIINSIEVTRKSAISTKDDSNYNFLFADVIINGVLVKNLKLVSSKTEDKKFISLPSSHITYDNSINRDVWFTLSDDDTNKIFEEVAKHNPHETNKSKAEGRTHNRFSYLKENTVVKNVKVLKANQISNSIKGYPRVMCNIALNGIIINNCIVMCLPDKDFITYPKRNFTVNDEASTYSYDYDVAFRLSEEDNKKICSMVDEKLGQNK